MPMEQSSLNDEPEGPESLHPMKISLVYHLKSSTLESDFVWLVWFDPFKVIASQENGQTRESSITQARGLPAGGRRCYLLLLGDAR